MIERHSTGRASSIRPQSIPFQRAAIAAFALAIALAPAAAAGPELVYVGPGSFVMGNLGGKSNERPEHEVRITRAFRMAARAVTFDEFDLFCAETLRSRPPAKGMPRGRTPVRSVTWFDAVDYCNWLSERDGLDPCYSGRNKQVACDFGASGYRLPTEAEWEYAARGGPGGGGGTYAGSDDPAETAWYEANSGDRIHPVGEKKPNPLGLYDMCGNLFEWCWDWYEGDYYSRSPGEDPHGPPPPESASVWQWEKSRRGGSWRESAADVAVWVRSRDSAAYVGDNGFRIVRRAD